MKILYKQLTGDSASSLTACGIEQCHLRYLLTERDDKLINKKAHHHASYEIHILADGWQTYEIDRKHYRIESGNFLLIPPLLTHKVLSSAPQTKKYAVVFNAAKTAFPFSEPFGAVLCSTPLQVTDILEEIFADGKAQNALDLLLHGNRIFEVIVSLMRMSGAAECSHPLYETEEDLRLTLARQFVIDNINLPLTVADLASYCNLSEKQLTRLFLQYEGSPPKQYIQRQKVNKMEQLLADHTLSLKEISEQMHFSSEYYFNSYFKKHFGMPPGMYRKMYKKEHIT